MSDELREPSKEDVEAIQSWLLGQPHLPDHLDEIMIKRFIFSCKHNMQLTKDTIDLFFTIRHNAPVVFANRDPLAQEVKRSHNTGDIIVLPHMTKDNYRIILNRLRDKDPDHYFYNELTKTFFMLMDTRLMTERDLAAGEIHIFDSEGSTLRHLSKWVLSTVKIYMNYTQNAMPVKLKQVHILNCPTFIDKVLFILKPMMKEGIMDHIFTHSTGSTTLFNHIPKDLLPNEYGGTCGSLETFKMDLINKMEGMRDFFLDEDKWKVDESKRPNTNGKIKINEGSFKSLSID